MEYRIEATYRQWIGKPDPSGFSTFAVTSEDPSWIHEEKLRILKQGHRINGLYRDGARI